MQEGIATYIPMRLGEVPNRLRVQPYQTVMFQVAPMDEYGYFSMGTSCDYMIDFVKQAEVIIVQVNENMPRTFGQNQVHVSKVTAIVEATHLLAGLPEAPITDIEKIIGQYVADLVEDGSCV